MEGALEELDICQYLKLEALINKFKCPTKVVSYEQRNSFSKNP